ncbi:hypothetical protein B7C62_13570 [Kitasatospora albolonga]|uniref:HEAT repeat domain-containing protein n=1 Tax=Kitasatospora albolonga TaxID=68173 RepID=A0ABC8BTH2_9ACTN|nr:hypothetical protein B7C62_13570 [Kitasatospora albolonga]
MRSTRVALAVTAGALAPVLLLSGPASAASAAPSPVTVATTQSAGVAADSPYDDMDEHELRIEVFRILEAESTGRAVRQEAVKALEGGTVQHLLDFLKTGRWVAQAEDDRVAILTILADPKTGRTVKEAAGKALDGTDADRRHFLETGRWAAQAVDDRVAIFTLLAKPDISPALRAAAVQALEGTDADRRYFVETGQYEVDGR